ncbi:hypothetical protein LINPERHAP1_LOCUS31232 [Linum perenne]
MCRALAGAVARVQDDPDPFFFSMYWYLRTLRDSLLITVVLLVSPVCGLFIVTYRLKVNGS